MRDKLHAHHGGDALDTIKDNLALWHGDITRLEELSCLQAQSAAHALAQGTSDPDALPNDIQRLWGEEAAASLAVRAAQVSERLALCRELREGRERVGQVREHLVETPEAPLPIAVLSGPTFAAAVTVFSTALPKARTLPCHSFSEILEEVAGGRAAFGILPIEDSAQGRLFRIYEQCESFELHIACTTDIKDENGKTVRMALLYKGDAHLAHAPSGERTLECLLYGDEGALIELLSVATALGFTLRRVDSVPLSYREDGFVQHVVLCGEHGDTDALMTYLRLFMPHTTVTADYIHIKVRETP